MLLIYIVFFYGQKIFIIFDWELFLLGNYSHISGFLETTASISNTNVHTNDDV